MLKKVFVFAIAGVLLASCGTQGPKTEAVENAATEVVAQKEVTTLSFEAFAERAGELVGQEVAMEGTVLHVCQHGGKKMFIAGDNEEIRVKLVPSDEMGVFNQELVGSTVKVKGFITEPEVENVPDNHEEDADHKNHYHKKQYHITCTAYEEVATEEVGETAAAQM